MNPASLLGDPAEATLLVCDDKENTREAIIAFLEFEGFTVRRAASADEALALLKVSPPDLLLTDGMMPGMDGLDLLKAIRATPGISDLPVIMVTARGDTSDIALALKAGATDYLVKPVQLELLVCRVRTALKLHRLEQRQRTLTERLKKLNNLTDWTLQIVGVEGSEPVRLAAEEIRALLTDILKPEAASAQAAGG